MNTSAVNLPPDLWQLEIRVIELTAESEGISREKIRPDSRILEDLHIDSLGMVELLMTLEEQFGVSIPDDIGKQMFIRSPLTVTALAEIVRHQWGTGTPSRERWIAARPEIPTTDRLPFTQLDGLLSPSREPLLSQLTATSSGWEHFRRRTDGMRCVLVPGSEVELGSGEAENAGDESPRHRVHLQSFLMDAEPVSVTAFARFLSSIGDDAEPFVAEWCGVDPSDRRSPHFQLSPRWGNRWGAIPGTECQPMVLVSWFGAAAYSLWAGGRNWRAYRTESLLPTEAQWEYAARGALARAYPWGEEPATPERACVGHHRARQSYPGLLPMADVHQKLGMSPFDLHHMAGNVWQWCRDWYDPDFYRTPESGQPNPRQDRPTGIRSERGGSWVGPGELARSSYRRGRPPEAVGRCLGFRCAGLVENLPA
ncbi:MAG: Serine/threonine-protein kinase pkn1 [Verrucomicrobiota bacterium]|jgi:acyl carrier protein